MNMYGQSHIKKIVVLGHSGFIGSHLLRALSHSLPQAQVIGCSFPEFDLTQMHSVEELKSLFDRNTIVVKHYLLLWQYASPDYRQE